MYISDAKHQINIKIELKLQSLRMKQSTPKSSFLRKVYKLTIKLQK